MGLNLPKLHPAFKIGGLLSGLASVAYLISQVPAPQSKVVAVATGISLILAALGVHGDQQPKQGQ